MSRPLIIIAFDSLDPELLRTWVGSGELPTFAALFQTASWATVDNPRGFESGGAWMAFMTGVPPDQHGVYDAFYRFNPETYGIDIVGPPAVGWPSLWSRASRSGRRVAAVDVPYDFMDPELNGVHVCDWLVHVSSGYQGPGSNSERALQRIHRDYGLNPISCQNRCAINEQEVHSAQGLSRVLEIEEKRIDWKTRFCGELLREEAWDLFLTVFHEAHDVGHMCWHAHDRDHDWHDPRVTAEVGDPLLRVYKKLDRATAELLDRAPADARVMVYSSHGIGPERTATRLLDSLLLRLEQEQTPGSSDGWLDTATKVYHSLVPAGVRQRLARSGTVTRAYAKREEERLHRRRYLAISPAYATGGVHLNVRGRERHGTVPEAQFEPTLDLLTEELSRLTNAETGEPLVRSVIRTSALYDGPRRGVLPDLLLEWNTSAPIRRIGVPQLGEVLENAPTVRSGDHFLSKQGILFTLGRGIAGGEQAPIHVTDLSASVLGLVEADLSGLPGQAVSWLGGDRKDPGASG